MPKLDAALDAPMEGDPMNWLWSLAAATKPRPKTVPDRFEELAIAGLACAATALSEPKNGWGIGFARVADVGAQLLAICPTERLAKGVLGLAALSGIGGDVVTKVRRSKSHKPIAKALAEYDRREAKAETYPAMRKAMVGFADEVFPKKTAKKKAAKKAPALRLHFANGRVIESGSGGAWGAYREALRETTGPKRKGKDERRVVAPEDVSPKERQQLVGILAKAFGLKEKSFEFADVFSGKSKHEVVRETRETPIEWWDIIDDAKKVRFQMWFYHADCGSLVLAGTAKRVASIIQYGFSVEVKDPGGELARAMEVAHRDLAKRCPKSELAGADFTLDEDD